MAGVEAVSDEGRPTPTPTVSTETVLAFLGTLSDVPDPDTVTFAMCRGLLASFAPDTGSIYRVTMATRSVRLMSSHGAVDPRMVRTYTSMTMDMHIPVTEVAQSGERRVHTAQYVADNYPLTAPYYNSRPPEGEVAYVPVRHRGAVVAVLTFEFRAPVDRTWELHQALDTACSATALWLLAYDALNAGGHSVPFGVAPSLELSSRQREVILLMRAGKSNREIAEALGYSIATIKADITSMSVALGARGRVQLLEQAERAGF